jgi:hypothetical protein
MQNKRKTLIRRPELILLVVCLFGVGCPAHDTADSFLLDTSEVELTVNILGYSLKDNQPYATLEVTLRELKGDRWYFLNSEIIVNCDNQVNPDYPAVNIVSTWFDNTTTELSPNAQLSYRYDLCLDPKSFANANLRQRNAITRCTVKLSLDDNLSEGNDSWFVNKSVDSVYKADPNPESPAGNYNLRFIATEISHPECMTAGVRDYSYTVAVSIQASTAILTFSNGSGSGSMNGLSATGTVNNQNISFGFDRDNTNGTCISGNRYDYLLAYANGALKGTGTLRSLLKTGCSCSDGLTIIMIQSVTGQKLINTSRYKLRG